MLARTFYNDRMSEYRRWRLEGGTYFFTCVTYRRQQFLTTPPARGGMKVGQVIGSTDARGERPKDRPLHPNGELFDFLIRVQTEQHSQSE